MTRLINRDLSWLQYSKRVLHKISSNDTPLLERLKFCDIFIRNLDDFYMKRISILRNIAYRGPDVADKSDSLFYQVKEEIIAQNKEFSDILNSSIYPNLEAEGIFLKNWQQTTKEQKEFLNKIFLEEIFPILTPLVVGFAHPFPRISNLSKSLGIIVRDPKKKENLFARIKIPKHIKQWYNMPSKKEGKYFIHIDEIIENNLTHLFVDIKIVGSTIFKITRDMCLNPIVDGANFKGNMYENLRGRKFSPAIKLEYPENGNMDIINYIKERLDLEQDDIFVTNNFNHYTSFEELTLLDRPELKYQKFIPRAPQSFTENEKEIFHDIAKKDTLVFHPYESFSGSTEGFILKAAKDKDVLAIKMTIYRTQIESNIIKSLIKAARHGKQVTVVVELHAEFDEESNLEVTNMLEKEGIHVLMGIVGFKIHAKMCMIVRRDPDGIRPYVHISTGNYNPNTAKTYSDIGIFTADKRICKDIIQLFNYLTGISSYVSYKNILSGPLIKTNFIRLIENEITNKKKNLTARIIIKVNALEDIDVINKLYEASNAGVEIDLIVRDFCCLVPGIENQSKNIKVHSVVGRFLEHSRIYYFHDAAKNTGEGKLFMGSCDWMNRNLQRRVELVVPIKNKSNKKELWEILQLYLQDNQSRWEMQPDGKYKKIICTDDAKKSDVYESMLKKFKSKKDLASYYYH